jgi:aldehyde:ferredoxin oxidoreductase
MYFVRVNMTDLTYEVTEVPEKYKSFAGRGLTSSLIADEVPPQSHALGPSNKLVFSPGYTTGTSAPTSARISVGGKSPLTGGIKEANAGTSWAADLAVLNIKALIIEGFPEEKGKYWGIAIKWDGKPKIEFFEANQYIGKPLTEVHPAMYEKFGEKVSVCSIGMAAEHGYSNSGVACNDQSKNATRYAGRGG